MRFRIFAAIAASLLFASAAEAAELCKGYLTDQAFADEARQRGRGGARLDRPWFEIEIAPQVVSEAPLRSGATATDATAVSWTAGINLGLGCDYTLELTAGPSADMDSDGDAEEASSFSAAARLDWVTGPLAPFALWTYERSYTHFFDEEDGSEHAIEVGVAPSHDRKPWSLSSEAAVRYVETGEQGGDYFAARFKPEVDLEVVTDAVSLHLDAEVEWRRYRGDHPDLISDGRRDRRLAAFFGIDFMQAINKRLGFASEDPDDPRLRQPVIRHAMVGVRWSDVNSNVADEREHEFQFAPAFTVRVGF